MTSLTIEASQFRSLVTPVLPLASGDHDLPVLNAVHVEAEGKWLSATATDRFRVGIKRIKKYATDDDPSSTEWEPFSALIPVRAVKSLLATFKPKRGTLDPTLTLTVDGPKLISEATGVFDLFDSGRFVHWLEPGEFPKVRSLIRKALDTPVESRVSHVALNPQFFADFKATGANSLRVLLGTETTPMIVMDDDGFIGALMPRRSDGERDDWSDFLAAAEAKPEPKKRAARKPAKAAS